MKYYIMIEIFITNNLQKTWLGLSVSTTGIYGYLWIFSLVFSKYKRMKWSTDINNSLKDHDCTYKMFVSFYNESLSSYDFNQIT